MPIARESLKTLAAKLLAKIVNSGVILSLPERPYVTFDCDSDLSE